METYFLVFAAGLVAFFVAFFATFFAMGASFRGFVYHAIIFSHIFREND